MCVCVYTYTHTHTHTCMYTHTCILGHIFYIDAKCARCMSHLMNATGVDLAGARQPPRRGRGRMDYIRIGGVPAEAVDA